MLLYNVILLVLHYCFPNGLIYINGSRKNREDVSTKGSIDVGDIVTRLKFSTYMNSKNKIINRRESVLSYEIMRVKSQAFLFYYVYLLDFYSLSFL